MSVTGVAKELIGRRSGSEGENGNEYSRTFLVETDNKHDGPKIVLSAFGLPEWGQTYATETETDLDVMCLSRNPKLLRGHTTTWEVECRWRQPSSSDITLTGFENPLTMRPIIAVTFETVMVPAVAGILVEGSGGTGTYTAAFKNSAGDEFDPPPTMERSNPIIEITRNEQAFYPAVAALYSDGVNADPWFGLRPRQALMRGITTPGRQEVKVAGNKIAYYPVSYTVAVNYATWDVQALDQGANYLENPLGPFEESYQFFSKDGYPKIGRLNGSGQKLDIADADVFRQLRARKELYFSWLNLPQQMI